MTSFLHMFDNASMVGFYALALVAIIASLRVVIHANPVHAILSMIVSLLAVAGIFFILGAPFAGALEIIVYAGAILVLFVFVIMMLNLGMANEAREKRWLSAQTWALPTGLALVIALVLFSMIGLGTQSEHAGESAAVLTGATVSAAEVGISLFTQYLLLVEVAAMLLLAALVAAYHLGKKALDDENFSHSSQQFQPSVGSIHEYDDNDATNAVEMAEPYVYHSVDAQQFKDKHNAANSIDDINKTKNLDVSSSAQERR
ncbi:NADH-quinone oxidoreductase subunit J [Psychrobacter sp. I-STPA10]|uniref:NADH-quinone oxidoreductase subunit J n=1 Tax=Psychrobacter sp. I-STPA10 TaxID=2585769 RepID=UPI001E593BBF|nr:NADH-quinone oxidoreductase subunit J [Psychrobacter sp. I-STPA10]